MKKLFTIVLTLSSCLWLSAQTVVYNEGFEGASPNVTASPANSWAITTTVAASGSKSDTSQVPLNDTTFLTTTSFSTVGNTFITVEFDHICMAEFSDEAIIQVSVNGGSTWTTVTSVNAIYQPQPPGSSPWVGSGSWNYISYSDWLSANGVVSNSLWHHEWFDMSTLLANQANCKLRFALLDGDNDGPGGATYTGWYVDDIKVTIAPCELVPPTVNQVPDPIIYAGQVYYTGPYKITAEIKDNSSIDTALLTYTVNGGAPVYTLMSPITMGNDTFTASIPALNVGDSVCYMISAQDSSPCGNWNYIPGPGSTSCTSFIVNKTAPPSCNGTPILVNPSHLETFDSWVTGNGGSIPGTIKPNWYDPPGYGVEQWWVQTGSTPNYPTTGPPYDHTSGSGNYLYMEASYVTPTADTSIIVSPCFDLDSLTTPTLEFFFHSNTNNSALASIHVDIHDGLQWNLDVDTIWGHYGMQWQRREVNLTGYGSIIQIRFRANETTSTSWGDVAIDDFHIYDKMPWDAAATQLITPGPFAPQGVQDSVTVKIFNYGVNTITSMNLNYSVNGGAPVTEPWTGSLATNSATTYKFSTKYTVPSGPFNVCAWVSLANDGDSSNDTICGPSNGLRTDTTTYADNFDTDTVWVSVPGAKDKWEIGTPNFGATNSTYSGVNSWDVNLSTATNEGQEAYLYTQYFDLTNAKNSRLSFWHNFNTYIRDGMSIEYSTDGGKTWLTLGILNDPLGVNWYSYSFLGIPGNYKVGWSGASGGWTQSQYDMTSFDGTPNIQFRFLWVSYNATWTSPRDGYSIDNFQLIDPLANDVEMVEIVRPVKKGCLLGTKDTIEVRVRNVGQNTASNIPVYFEMNGVVYGPDTVPGPLATWQDTTVVFDQAYVNMQALGAYGVRAWTAWPGDMDQNNDTLAMDSVYNITGCELTIEMKTGTTVSTSTSYWWEVRDPGNTPVARKQFNTTQPNTTYIDKVCLQDGLTYTYQMQANSTWHPYFKVWAYDTIYYQGGGMYTSLSIPMNCPPMLTAKTNDVWKQGATKLPLPQPYTISTTIECDGLTNIDTVLAVCEINGAPFDVDTVVTTPSVLSFGDQMIHSFNRTWNAAPGCYEIKVWTEQPEWGVDLDPVSDTSVINVCIFDSTTVSVGGSYCSNFDGSQPDWVSLNALTYDNNSGWQKGTPNQTIINAAYSSPNAWMTRLDTNYFVLDSSSLYTPMFVVDSGRCYRISFEHIFDCEQQVDGGHVEYSLDKGLTWKLLGVYNDTVNWYNMPNITGINPYPKDGFSGSSTTMPNSNGWVHSTYTTTFPLPGDVVFRFRWTSDGSSYFDSEGWAIDNFCFDEVGPCVSYVDTTTGIAENGIPGFELGQNMPNPTNGLTSIRYELPNAGQVNFGVTNVLGEKIYEEAGEKSAGRHKVTLNVKDWAEGVYYYYVEYDNKRLVKKMVITE